MAQTESLSPEIQKTLADPEFLKLPGSAQVEVLDHLHSKAQTAVRPTPPPAPPQEGLPTKLGRGTVLGAASGIGIPETTSGAENVKGFAKNVAGGVAQMVNNPLEATVGIGKNIYGAGKEAWQGLADKDPEQFAHGFGSAVAQILTLRSAAKGAYEGAIKPSADTRLAKAASATNASGDVVPSLKTAMPDIIKTAKGAGIDTVGKLVDTVTKASKTIDAQFNQALDSIKHQQYVPFEISQKLNDLITPDMKKTAEGRADAAEIRRAAREYQTHWTLEELNAKRMTENENLKSFYNKNSQGQAASPLQQHISKAVRDGAANIVYNELDNANPGIGAQDMKARQAALWDLGIHLEKETGKLEAKQLKHETSGPLARMHTGTGVTAHGAHGYLSGFQNMFSEGPAAEANANVKAAFNPSLGQRAGQLGKPLMSRVLHPVVGALPITVLAGQTKSKMTPPPNE